MLTAFLMVIFFANIMAITIPQIKATDSEQISLISILAKGIDQDIPNARTFIEGKIEYDKNTGMLLGKVNFHIDIFDENDNKIYTMKGELKDAMVLVVPFLYCPVRDVIWTDLWYVIGTGILKTSDTTLTIDYRGTTITLPNTGGQYIPATIVMAVSPYGEHVDGIWSEGPWAHAGIPGFGGVTYLLKYNEILL